MALTEMALTENAKRPDGWQDQAEHLALSHVAVALTIMAAVERARWRFSLGPALTAVAHAFRRLRHAASRT